MSKTAVVTDAYGFYGALIRAKLADSGWSTVAAVDTPRPGDNAVAWSLGDPAPESALLHADALVHCAYDLRPRTREDVWRINVGGSAALLAAAVNAGVNRTILLSSMSAFSGTTQVYGQARLNIESICLGLGGIVVRPGLVYGPREGGMVATLRRLTRLPIVPDFGDGAWQFPVHSADLVSAITRVLETSDWFSEVIGVAQPEAVTFRAMLSGLARDEDRTCRFIPVHWRVVYWLLRLLETSGVGLPASSDALLGLVRPASFVPRGTRFPDLIDALTVFDPENTRSIGGHSNGSCG